MELSDVLSCLPFSEQLLENSFKWKVFFLEGVGRLRGKQAIAPLSEEINNSIDGFKTTYKFLMEMSEDLDQIIEVFLVAHSGEKEINKQKTDGEFYELYDYTIELFDSSYWIVCCKDKKYVKALEKRFNDVSVSEFIPS